jgi:Do/DeqQ family serine protease
MNERTGISNILKTVLILMVILVIGWLLLVFSNYYASGNQEKSENKAKVQENDSSGVIVGPTNIADMVEKVSPAVVNIETTVVTSNSMNDFPLNDPFFRQFFGDNSFTPKPNVQKGIGTGFVISKDGYVVTNQHVIDKASKITVNFDEDKQYEAKVVGQDYELDLAVLKIDGNKNFTTVKIGDSDSMRVGDWVIAIGNPYGLDHTVTAGVVSAKGRPIEIEDRVYKNLIQTDAAINPGNSGGPLLNTKGEIIGINTAVNAQAQGIGFAIPINTAKEVLNELIENGKIMRPYMGIWLQPVDEEIARHFGIEKKGIIILNITSGGPADKAGVLKYDVIVSIDEKEINSYDDLQEFLQDKKVGDRIMLEISRNGKPMLLPLNLAEKP